MGHKKVPAFCKATIVQRKFCVPFPCPFCSTYFHVYFCCMGKIILRTCNGEKKVKERCTYVKQEPESCSSVKNYPSVKTELVFSDSVKRHILVL